MLILVAINQIFSDLVKRVLLLEAFIKIKNDLTLVSLLYVHYILLVIVFETFLSEELSLP